MPTIDVSTHVKERLDAIKEQEEHRSYDSAVRALLREYECRDRGGNE